MSKPFNLNSQKERNIYAESTEERNARLNSVAYKSKEKILALFKTNPNNAYEFSDLHKLVGGVYGEIYKALQQLVNEKKVVGALAGLNGGRKKTYFVY